MTNEHNFKAGDKVRHLGYDLCGIITNFLGERFVKVRAIDDEIFSIWDINNLELYDRKTAFLTELQALLRKYDARIGDSGIYEIEGIEITFGDDTPRVRYGHSTITADNIMDFDKE